MSNEGQQRKGFDLVLEQLIDLHEERKTAAKGGSHQLEFKNVMRELIIEREKAAINSQRIEFFQRLERERKEYQELLLKERRDAEEERHAAQARQDMLLSNVLKAVNHHRDELSFLRTSSVGGEFASTPSQAHQNDILWTSPQKQTDSESEAKLIEQQEETKRQQQILVRFIEKQKEEIATLRLAASSKIDSIETEPKELTDLDLSEFSLKEQPGLSEFGSGMVGLTAPVRDDQRHSHEEFEIEKVHQHYDEELEKCDDSTEKIFAREPSYFKDEFTKIAEGIFRRRTNDPRANTILVKEIFLNNNATLSPVLELCPNFASIIAHMLVLRLGWTVGKVDYTLTMISWDESICRLVGRSMATYIQNFQSPASAVEAWRLNYPQLNSLFEIAGFDVFMNTITEGLLKENKYGLIYRVSIGAILSTLDAGTDVYVIGTYISQGLKKEAATLLTMICLNLFFQLVVLSGQYMHAHWSIKVKEALICLTFLRPAVDAYRVSTLDEDRRTAANSIDPLAELTSNKGIELGTESIPACVLQIYVYMTSPEQAGEFALVSILISTLTTGFSSSMISFDLDCDPSRRKAQPQFYGFVKDDSSARFKTFFLMTLAATFHNTSRSIGCALLVANDQGSTLLYLLVGEVAIYLSWKMIRCNFLYYVRVDGALAVLTSFQWHLITKIIADFTGCFHLRHPYCLGGLPFSLTLLWAQIFPFVALHLMEEDTEEVVSNFDKGEITNILTLSFLCWLATMFLFSCTIDLSFIGTFFDLRTGSQYAREWFLQGTDDEMKFLAAFDDRMSWKEPIKEEIKQWVNDNIARWSEESVSWMNAELIPDEYLPPDALNKLGGVHRRRSSGATSLRELVGLPVDDKNSRSSRYNVKILPENRSEILGDAQSSEATVVLSEWLAIAEKIYAMKSNNYKSNYQHIMRVFNEDRNKELLQPLLTAFPNVEILLAHALEDRFGFRVRDVSYTSKINSWSEVECRKVGEALSTFIRKRKTGDVAIDAWRLHYVQLEDLFAINGFEGMMLVFANNLLRDSIYGMVLRVSMGAALSITDAVTDIYVISTYYKSEELYGQANTLLAMVIGNIFFQLINVLAQYKGKNWGEFLREAFITVLFLRPAVDAYRVSMNQDDSGLTYDPLSEMVINKCSELACESIPGCVLQLYVWLLAPEKAGSYALVSIGISCLTTGFASAMIAFDMDVDVHHRKNQPNFYGYIPNDHGLRGRCFIMMTLMSALHNMSRSLGCALLLASDAGTYLFSLFVGGEIGLYLVFKILGRDFYYWPQMSASIAVFGSLFSRIITKVVVDFSGCIHLRHPYELGGWGFTLSIAWAQTFPFVVLAFFYSDEGDNSIIRDSLKVFLAFAFFLWLLLNIIFFCTIDLKYLNTFFGTMTGSKYTCNLFLMAQDDHKKFDAVFTNRIEYTKKIHCEVKEWVAENIDQWRRDQPDWFKIEMIPDFLLPENVFEIEGGSARKRSSSVSLREFVGLGRLERGRKDPSK